jgi:hypothetical protein
MLAQHPSGYFPDSLSTVLKASGQPDSDTIYK